MSGDSKRVSEEDLITTLTDEDLIRVAQAQGTSPETYASKAFPLPFTITKVTTSPNNVVPVAVLAASGGESQIDVVLAPKIDPEAEPQSGAIQIQTPDGTATGGNKRGGGAFDLQTSRDSADRVISGQNSFGFGANNKVTSNRGGAAGQGNTVTDNNSFAFGLSNTVSDEDSLAVGDSNTVSAARASAIGSESTVDATYSNVIGYQGASRGVEMCYVRGADNDRDVVGTNQVGDFSLTGTTTNATPYQLSTRAGNPTAAASNQITLPNKAIYAFSLVCVAVDQSNGDSKTWRIDGRIKRGASAATTTLASSSVPIVEGDASLTTAALAVTADTTVGALAVTATGIASTTIRWHCSVRTTEIQYAA